MSRARVVLGIAGGAFAAYGVVHLLLGVGVVDLLALAGWLVAAVVIHDFAVAPLTVVVGRALTSVPARVRRYLQGALIAGALVTVVALPLIALRGSQPSAKAILQRNYAAGLLVLLALITATAVVRYAIRVGQDRVRRAERSD